MNESFKTSFKLYLTGLARIRFLIFGGKSAESVSLQFALAPSSTLSFKIVSFGFVRVSLDNFRHTFEFVML